MLDLKLVGFHYKQCMSMPVCITNACPVAVLMRGEENCCAHNLSETYSGSLHSCKNS